MAHLRRDVQFGVRNLLKHPGSTAVVVLALAIGIGGNSAIFSVVHATLLAPLPYDDADRIVMVWSKPRPQFRNSGFAGAFWLGRAMQGMFEGVPGIDTARFALIATALVGTAALACYLPARRASRVDPLSALREE